MEVLKDTKLCMSVHCLLFFHVHLLKCSAVHSAVFSNDGHTHTHQAWELSKTQISAVMKLTFHGEFLLSAWKRNWQ